MLKVRAAVVVSLLAAACDPGPGPASEWRFDAPLTLWLRSDARPSSVFLVEAPGAREYALVTAPTPDGGDGVFLLERLGGAWSAPVFWPRPPGMSSERVEWVTSTPTAAIATLGTGPGGTAVFVRAFESNGWLPPVAVTLPGAERPLMARIAAGPPGEGGRGALHLAYGVEGGACAGHAGVQIRHRRAAPGGSWSTWALAADTCGLDSLSIAVARTPMEPLALAWTGPSVLNPDAMVDAVAAYARVGLELPMFSAPLRLASTIDRGIVAVPMEGGSFFAAWQQLPLGADETSQRRALSSTFSPATEEWSAPDYGWFLTRVPPFAFEAPSGGALVFASDLDAPNSGLVVRRWASPQRSVASRSPVSIVYGDPTSLRAQSFADGSLRAAWIEETPGGVARVQWAQGVRAVVGDAGR